LTILSRAGVPKVRGEMMQSNLGEDFAKKIVDDPGHIKQLFPRIKQAGTDAILTSCQKAVAGNEIFQALNAVGAPQKAIDAAVAFDPEKQDVYDLIERGLQFARADALAQHHDIQAVQPFNRHSSSRIAHAALVQVKEYCGLWGHTGLPLKDVLDWLGLTYGLDPEICREALILGANKRGLHVDDGRNRHIFLKDHYEAECKIYRIVCALEGVKSKSSKTALSKSARIMAGSAHECIITFCLEQRNCLAGLIEWKLAILTGGPGAGKSTLITALNDHYEGLLVVVVAAKAALQSHEISGARHTTIYSVIEMEDGEDRWLSGVRVLVIEEASMVGSIQMAKLLEAALHYGVQKIVLCGDPDQLAPIHNGSPFVDLIKSGKVPVFRLTENHRTDPASLGIAEFCSEILEGEAL
jgi:exodeoxyribonuclease V alpha subunit